MHSKSIKRIALICALIPLSLSFQCPTPANPLYLTEAEVIERSNWVILVRSTKMPNYLKYPGSQVFPLTQVRFSYLKWLGANTVGPNLYEDLWYHSGLPIGCRRYNLLPIDKFDLGTIFVQPNSDTSADTRALANAIIRIAVDLNLQQIEPSAVIVPQEMCQQLVSDLGSFGFHQRTVHSGAQASIHLVSNPRVFDEYLYHDK